MVEIFDNIRKIYTFSVPRPELVDYVEFFSESSHEETNRYIGDENFTVKMFPSFTPTIYINLGAPYQIQLGDKSYFIKQHEDVLIVRDGIAERHNLPNDHILTIKFFPGGLEAIFGINQAKFINKVIDVSDIIPASLIYNINQRTNFEERVQLLQNLFLQNLLHKQSKDHYVTFVQDTIQVYETSGMQYNNSQLAEKMFTTSKTINRYFNNVVGTTPKHYFSIFRTRVALGAFVNRKDSFDPSDFGYYDMSHFYKDVVKFTGQKLGCLNHDLGGF